MTTNKDTPKDPYQIFTDQKVELKSFSDALLSLKKSEAIVEFYIGDQSATMQYDDFSVPENSSIYGKIIDVLDSFVLLQCMYLEGDGSLAVGNNVFINTSEIKAMTVLDTKGSLKDIFLSSRDAKAVRRILNQN